MRRLGDLEIKRLGKGSDPISQSPNFSISDLKRPARGITTLEYAVLLACLVAALVSFQTGLRRSLCAKWREAADSFGSGRQYNPDTTTVVNL